MLSRKVSVSGAMSAVAGIDRGRVGERLHAALAGLQELHLLREKQSDMVNWALRMGKEEQTSPVQTSTDGSQMGTEEERLEATLTALKQQLSRLRRQDVGLKTHLQQLDQQISELKLDVNKASIEQLESDSRPSSGFYELSDGGSCSLSNSCTSVYSECLSSSSQSSLLLSPTSLAASQNPNPPALGDVCRRRSADESTTQPNPQRAPGPHLGSSRIRAGAMGVERPRPRPVSTGDLDNMLTSGPGCYKSVDGKKLSPCPSVRPSAVDAKFQSSLVSRGGTEVYHYPSPLHAVALQSPIFSPGGDAASPRRLEAQGPPEENAPSTDTLHGPQATRHLGYIDKILQRTISKIAHQSEAEVGALSPEMCQAQPLSTGTADVITPDCDWRRQCMSYSSQEHVLQASYNPSLASTQASFRYSFPAAMREFGSSEVIPPTTKDEEGLQGGRATVLRTHSDKRYKDVRDSRGPERKGIGRSPVVTHSSSAEEGQGFEVCAGNTGPSDFVHARFVPAGCQRVRVRQADRKTKAVKLRRRSSEKPRVVRHQQGYSSGERTREGSSRNKEERESKRSGIGKATQKLTACLAEGRRHCSGGSPGAPGLMYTHKVHPKPHPVPGFTKSNSRRAQCLEYEQPMEPRKRRQGAGKGPSHAEVLPATYAHRQRSREQDSQATGSRQKVPCGSSRPHSGQWLGPPLTRQSSTSSSLYNSLNARYPPAPYSMSYHYPPRCESEYSAECASLFHSTIAESSEGEMSDTTTNHFGDSESSQSFQSCSDSDSSLSPDEGDQVDGYGVEGGLVWADSALRSTGLRLQPLPRAEPPTCRIKASRALKKKIRRFQPASLKVMTLV